MLLRGLESAPDPFRIGPVVEPGQIGVNERPGRFSRGHRDGHGAPKVRLKSRLDRSLGGAACGLNHLGVLKDAARDVRGRLEGTRERRPPLLPCGLDHPGKSLGVAVDQQDALLPDCPQAFPLGRADDQFFKQGRRKRCAEGGNAASPDPGPPAGNLL